MIDRSVFRENFEAQQIKTCIAAAVCYAALALWQPVLGMGAATLSLMFVVLGAVLSWKTRANRRFECRMLSKCESYSPEEFLRRIATEKDFLLGEGFAWERSQCQAAHDMSLRDMDAVYLRLAQKELRRQQGLWHLVMHPWVCRRERLQLKNKIARDQGMRWIHALEESQRSRTMPWDDLLMHTLVVGSTGSGKTSLLLEMIGQAVANKDFCVIIIDPKGDVDFPRQVQKFCDLCHREFTYFNVAQPEASTPVNLLANPGRVSELASRIAQVLPGDGDNDPFRQMGEAALNALFGGAKLLGEKMSFQTAHRNLLERVPFAVRVLTHWLTTAGGVPAEKLPKGRTRQETCDALVELFEQSSVRDKPSELLNVIDLARKTDERVDKTLSGVKDFLAQFSEGDLGALLSPSETSVKAFTDAHQVIARNSVFYFAADPLHQKGLGRKLGELFMTDLAAEAGDIYNYAVANGEKPRKVLVVVDEASEVCCDAMLAMLSKSRGAGLGLVLATQSVADFVSRFGKTADKDRVLANIMTRIVMRLQDDESRRTFTQDGPKTSLYTKARSRGVSMTSESLLLDGMNLGERETEVPNMPLIDPNLFTSLPKGEAFVMTSAGFVTKIRVPYIHE